MQDNLRMQCENFPPQMPQEEKPEEPKLKAYFAASLFRWKNPLLCLMQGRFRDNGTSCSKCTTCPGGSATFKQPVKKKCAPLGFAGFFDLECCLGSSSDDNARVTETMTCSAAGLVTTSGSKAP